MIEYTYYTPDGEFIATGKFKEAPSSQHRVFVEGSHPNTILVNGIPQQLPNSVIENRESGPPTSNGYVWDGVSWSFRGLELDAQKSAKWILIKQFREQAIESDLITPYGIFDNKSKDQDNIDKVIRWMQTKGVESVDFTMADNSVQNLTMAQMLDVGVRTGDKVLYAHAKGRILRAQIEQATTIEEIEAITWD